MGSYACIYCRKNKKLCKECPIYFDEIERKKELDEYNENHSSEITNEKNM